MGCDELALVLESSLFCPKHILSSILIIFDMYNFIFWLFMVGVVVLVPKRHKERLRTGAHLAWRGNPCCSQTLSSTAYSLQRVWIFSNSPKPLCSFPPFSLQIFSALHTYKFLTTCFSCLYMDCLLSTSKSQFLIWVFTLLLLLVVGIDAAQDGVD